MSKVNFKQKQFIIPLILLPFLILGFFVFDTFKTRANKGKLTLEDSTALVSEKGLNSDMPKVSTDVSSSQTKDKFGAYTEAYKNQTDHSALGAIDNLSPNGQSNTLGSNYSAADIQRLEANRKFDSMNKALEKNRAIIQQRINGFSLGNGTSGRMSRQMPYQNDNSSAEILEALKNHSQNIYGDANQFSTNKKPVGGSYEDQMRFFREQIKMVDSMQKASKTINTKLADDKSDGTKKTENKAKFDPSNDTSFKPMHVAAVEPFYSNSSGFNTVRKFKPDENIKAIIDESKKVTAGARVRIKLLQDVFVGDIIIPSGTFLYGIISGFQTQRVNITVTSVNQNGAPLPVKLDVYDNDGYLGLYVPNSNFREFTKDVGTQSTSGLSQIQTSNGTTSDIQSSLISKVFTSATNTAGKLIAQNKTTLKADYIIYLKENKSSNKF